MTAAETTNENLLEARQGQESLLLLARQSRRIASHKPLQSQGLSQVARDGRTAYDPGRFKVQELHSGEVK